MKIIYKFADGTASEVEVSDEIGTVIFDSRRVEENLDRKERYHCYSYDAVQFEGQEYGACDTYQALDNNEEENARIHKALNKLSDVQKRRLLMLAKGLSIREIARVENVHHRAIEDSISAARKKLQKNF